MSDPYGTLTLGRLTLTEPITVTSKGGDDRVLSLSGLDADQVYAHPTQDQIRARAEALLAYAGSVVPVRLAGFPHLDGWYRVGSPGAEEFSWYDWTSVEWTLDLTLVGYDSQVEFESRLVGGNRSHVSAATPVLWHAPPIGHDAYAAGTASPGYVARTGADGLVHAYLSIPAATNPRWGCPTSAYLAGAATVTVSGQVLTGTTCPDAPAGWSLSNGLLIVAPPAGTGTLLLTSYLTAGWGTPTAFDVARNGVSLGAAQHLTVIRNDPSQVVLRLTWDHAPARSTLDLSLKRGARHVALLAQQSNVAGPWKLDDLGIAATASDQLTAAGYMTSTTSDADGNRWVLGTTVACAAPVGMTTGIGLAATTPAAALPGYLGVVRAGASAATGDAAADINSQYLGTPAEVERAIRR